MRTSACIAAWLVASLLAVTACGATTTSGGGAADAAGDETHSGHAGHGAGGSLPHDTLHPMPDPTPIRLGPQGRHPQFVVKCPWSHSAPDDPIVSPGVSGASHLHEFFGATGADARSTGKSLEGSDTTCENTADTASYWVPALYDGGSRVPPHHVVAYYRTGVGVDPDDVEPWPLGLMMIAGNAGADSPQSTGVVGWSCGASDHLTVEPRRCTSRAPLTLRLTFPDCWDGRNLDSADHRGHLAYSSGGSCPPTHDVPIVQLILAVHYEFIGEPNELRLASGSILTGHGDVLNGWSRDELAHLTALCLRRGEICGVSSSRTDIDA